MNEKQENWKFSPWQRIDSFNFGLMFIMNTDLDAMLMIFFCFIFSLSLSFAPSLVLSKIFKCLYGINDDDDDEKNGNKIQ